MSSINQRGTSIFSHPGWCSYIQETWGLTPKLIESGVAGSGSTYASIHAFVNAKGRIRMPKDQPYLPVQFSPTPAESARKLESQWVTASSELARQMGELRYASAINLDPSTQDVRAWQVAGLHAEVRYTYHLPLPLDLRQASSAIRKNLKKADRAGFTSGRTTDIESVVRSLEASERRQGFEYSVSTLELERLLVHLGPHMARLYSCQDRSGNVVSARVVLVGDGVAVDWVAGTHDEALNSGATQQVIHATLQDLENDGVNIFDFGGANIPSVARSKLEWGGTLMPFYSLRPLGPRTLAIDGRRWLLAQSKKLREGRR